MTIERRTRTVHRGGIDLHVVERGRPADDTTTIVLVHGYPDTHAVWHPIADTLAERFHVVTYDVRGAGASTAPSSTRGYRIEELVRDLGAVIDATAAGRPVHLVGHDWGSIQSWPAVTSDDPAIAGRIASFTSISGPGLDQVGRWFDARRRQPGLRALRELARQGVRSWYVYAFHLPLLAPLAWKLGLARRWARIMELGEGIEASDGWPAPTLAADAGRGVHLYRANVKDRLSAPSAATTAVPVQVVVPTRDRFVTPALLDDLGDTAPDLWRREVPAGHWVVRSRPAAVARWITEFIDHLDGGPQAPGLARARRAARGEAGTGPDEGRLVVVTGAGSGIGRETALQYAARGATVVVADRNPEAAAATVELCAARDPRPRGAADEAAQLTPNAVAVVVDVSDTDAMERFAEAVAAEHGVPDIVVNNAGIGMAGGVLVTSVEDWEQILGVNLWGVIHGCRLFAAQMRERGEGGHIANVASAAAFTPTRTFPAYATTKAAVLMLSESLRGELVLDGIGVTAVCPGFVDTGIAHATRYLGVDAATERAKQDKADQMYKRRAFTPDRVAAAIVAGVEGDEPIVLAGFEAKASRFLSRFAPGAMRKLATVDMTP